ncbi:MAG: peroxiredoxin [Leptospiraceae bacterium]|nr:peroxiredoxin [Leptospiraceae bacterium]
MSLKNKKAPVFSLYDSDNQLHELEKYKGKKVLLVFYPGDDTAVCTKQLCSYNSGLDDFKELGVQILGINQDSLDSHKKFKEKYKLNFPLLSDPDGKICESYNAKSLFGTIKRSTFLINEDSTVVFENEVLPVFYKDREDILKEIKKLL